MVFTSFIIKIVLYHLGWPEYLIKNNLFGAEQFWFSHLVAVRIRSNVYIDLSKAFDTLAHTILREKHWYYGIRDTEHQLISK